MSKLIYKIMITIVTFILGLLFTNWILFSSKSLEVSAVDLNITVPQKTETTEEKEILPMLKMRELKINKVELGSKYVKVIQQIGKPLQIEKREYDNCGDGFRKSLKYAGLEISFISDEKGRDFTVASMNVTSSKWSVSGISIGADIKDVQTKFKNFHTQTNKDGLDILYFGNEDGWINFSFKDDKLVKISWEYNFC